MEEDLFCVAEAIAAFVERRGGALVMTPRQLTWKLIQYVEMRGHVPWHEIAYRGGRAAIKPKGWTADNERIWQDWITYTFELEDWTREVIQPIFGTDVREWEPGVEWRMELLEFLRHWIRRSIAIVEEFDPRDHTEERTGQTMKEEIDPYLIENGLVKGMSRQWIN